MYKQSQYPSSMFQQMGNSPLSIWRIEKQHNNGEEESLLDWDPCFGDSRFARFPSIPTLAITFSGLIDDMYSSYTKSEILSSDFILRFGDEYRVFGNLRLTPLIMKYNEITPKFFPNHTFTTVYGFSFSFFFLFFFFPYKL